MLSSLSAGLCGVVEVAWLGAVTTNPGAGMELQVIAAAVIGGANLFAVLFDGIANDRKNG